MWSDVLRSEPSTKGAPEIRTSQTSSDFLVAHRDAIGESSKTAAWGVAIELFAGATRFTAELLVLRVRLQGGS
jgi:hypothetical protein